jgi:ribosomal protein L11 methyltransferase
MRWAEICLLTTPPLSEAVATVLTEAGCSGAAIHDPHAVSSDPFAEWVVRDQDRPPHPAPNEPSCAVCGYIPVGDDLEPCLNAVREGLASLREAGLDAPEEISLRTVEEEAWANAWKAYFKPLRIGERFVVKPSWEPWEAAPNDRIIELDPGMAFGSGTHPTTGLCLRLLETSVFPGIRVLDWGTGSGILAVGAALLGARDVVAIDLDPNAVRAAAENAERNGFQSQIQVSAASIESLPDEPFDVVVANIVAAPIIAGANEIRQRVKPGGRVLVSGIIDQREDEVRAALQATGLTLLTALAEAEWRALLLSAPTSPQH